jgi:uncharacterized protein
MAEDLIRYDLLAQAALRGVVRTVLADAAKNGLPGQHHFKITFATSAPGVRLSERLRAKYPETMTIILQHQFWDLVVRDDAFEVGLSFGGVGEKLTIPLDAVTAFLDPSVQFGFEFQPIEAAAEEDAAPKAPAQPPARTPHPVSEAKQAESPPSPKDGQEKPPGGGGEVVSLDRFRKK